MTTNSQNNVISIKPLLLEKGFSEELINTVIANNKFKRLYNYTNVKKGELSKKVDIKFCVELYEKHNIPIYKLAMLYGVSDGSLREWMIKEGVSLKGHSCGKNSNNSYFDNIDSYDKAYFLGLLSADGAVLSNNPNSWMLRLELTTEDQYMLEKFNQFGNFNEKICFDNRDKNTAWITINSKHVAESLKHYGIVRNKSHLNTLYLPDFSRELLLHYIRGYFDGDGIAFTDGRIGFCGSEGIINDIHNHFVKEYGFRNTKITYNSSNKIYYAHWCRRRDVNLFYCLMYGNAKNLYLTRKREKIIRKVSPVLQRCNDYALSELTRGVGLSIMMIG